LQDGAEGSRPKKFWHRLRFGAELEELGKYRAKIVTYTSMLAVLLDSLQLAATERVDNKVRAGFTKVLDRMDGFEDMRKAVLDIATVPRHGLRNDWGLCPLLILNYRCLHMQATTRMC
jgi:hypothetical protein